MAILGFADLPAAAMKWVLGMDGSVEETAVLGRIAQKTRVKCFVFGRNLGDSARFDFAGYFSGAVVRDTGKLKRARPIWYGVDGWSRCHNSIMDPEFRCIANCMNSLQARFGLGSWAMGSGCRPRGNWLGRSD